MTKKEPISKILVNYGPREEQIIKELKGISKKVPIPDNKNEILRRGLHSVRFLADVDENFLLSLLSQLLHLGSTRYDDRILKLSKELAFTIYAIKISKYGVLRSEIFDSIPKELQLIEQLIEKEKPEPSEIEGDFKITMKKLANSVDTVFLKPLQEKESISPGMLFPIIFLNRMRVAVKIGKPKVMIRMMPTYEGVSSKPKRDFLKTCLVAANSYDDSAIKKLEKKLLTVDR